ncbi:MAG: efflux RND transporter periplasmic adaptor subunit [Chloroflexi bacterium]|nr:efflux RND transporter periplasmic adaptor subunit [Chloroflexota bacterium]
MKRWVIGITLLGLVVVGGYAAYATGLFKQRSQPATAQSANAGQTTTSATTTENTPLAVAQQATNGQIEVDARVVPVQYADLSFTLGGALESLAVKEGDQVVTGQLLARLNGAQQRVAMANAEATLQKAQAKLAELKSGARPQEIEQAQAALSAAQARQQRLTQAGLPGNIKTAEAALAASQAALAKVLEGASEQQLIAAKADLYSAQATIKQAQAAYNLVKWRNDVGALPESARLEQATTAYEAANARLADLTKVATSAEIAGANADVRRLQAQLEEIKKGMPADLAAADADVRGSQAQLDLLLAGARPEEIAAAEADVAMATAALQQTLVTLAETEIHAPFDGEVAVINGRVGEQVAPGAIAIRLANLSAWQIETEDLTELDIVGVAPGKLVTVTFDALPDLEIKGTVRYVRPIGGDRRGDIVYTVVVDPAQQDKRLLWNMTAVVTFDAK